MSALANEKEILCQTLFRRIAEGEKEAFHVLYDMTARAVYGYALSLMKNREDAEDIMQETYVHIRLSADGYQCQGKPMAWILTIARNLAYRKLQERQRSSFVQLEDVENRTDFSHITDMEQRLLLESAFLVLSVQERQIITLHVLAGMKHREISSMLQKPLSTVLSSYNRALKKLRRQLQGRNEG